MDMDCFKLFLSRDFLLYQRQRKFRNVNVKVNERI